MKISLYFITSLFFASLLYCSSTPVTTVMNQQPITDEQVTEAIDNIMNVYQGFYDIIEKHRDDPALALETGEIYLEDNKDRLHSHGYLLGQVKTTGHITMLHQYTIRVSVMSRKTGELLGPYYSAYPNTLETLGKLQETISIYCTRGAEKALE